VIYLIEEFPKKVIDGITFINCTPHPINFEDGTKIEGSVVCASKLAAKPIEKEVKTVNGIKIVTTDFKTTKEGEELVKEAKKKGYLLISSIIGAQAYKFPVVSPIATPETARLPPEQRKVFLRKWNSRE